MKITAADVIVTSPDRNFVTLKITTDEGVTGLGDAHAERPRAVGRDLPDASTSRRCSSAATRMRIEDTWQFLYRGGVLAARTGHHGGDRGGRRGAVGHQGQGRRACRSTSSSAAPPGPALLAYGHASGTRHCRSCSTRSASTSSRASARSACRPSVPGLNAVYGVAAQPSSEGKRYDYEPAQRTPLPAEEDWDSRAYLRHIPAVFEAVRSEFGPELPLLHDAHHRLTPIQAAQLGKSLEPYDLFWLEDCTPAENQEALRLVRQHTTTPLAIGEIFNTVWDYQTLIREQLIDYVRSAVTHTGGITRAEEAARLRGAVPDQVRHPRPDRHLAGRDGRRDAPRTSRSTTSASRSTCSTAPRPTRCSSQSFTFEDGYLHPGDQPGLGVELDEDAAARFPYEQAYLPYNRLNDGTVHDW